MNSILTSWKSTVSGVLTATLATSAAFLTPPLNTLVQPKTVLWLGAFQIIGKIWIGLISQDAGTVLATTPANPTPHAEPARETPIDPAATPVVASQSTEVKPNA